MQTRLPQRAPLFDNELEEPRRPEPILLSAAAVLCERGTSIFGAARLLFDAGGLEERSREAKE